MSDKLKHIKNSGFKTPDNYFNNLEDTIFSKLNTNSNLDSLDGHGFNVPDDYFSTIEDKVLNKLPFKEKEVKVVSLFNRRNILYFSGVAASIVLMFSIFTNETETISEELDYDLIANYIMEQNVSTYELADLLTDEDLTNINSDIVNEAFDDDSLENYLLDNVNLEDIIEQ